MLLCLDKPVDLKMDLPPAKLHNNYTATCIAINSRKPEEVEMTVDNEDCHYKTEVVNINEHASKVILTIEQVTAQCSGAMVNCKANKTKKKMRLEVRQEEITVTTPSPKPTVGEGTNPTLPTDGQHVDSSTSSITHSTTVMLIVTICVLWTII